jgi:GMP synthase (glutamine-hydrolysing)
MRKGEVRAVQKSLIDLGYSNLHVEDASDEFFAVLADVCDPEEKRQIIGNMFIEVQRRVFEKFISTTYNLQPTTWLLGQGTIYPDTIETGGTKHAEKIKTHHNRIPAIQAMMDAGRVIEPLKELYKDEVRRLGEELGLPRALVWRHPFPGPGLGVRILCDGSSPLTITPILIPHSVLPICSVGVQGDGRTYRHAVALFSDHPSCVHDEYWRLALDIPNRDARFNRVLLCTSHDHPQAIQCTPTFVTRETADLLREADTLVGDAVHRHGLSAAIWQFPVVLLPCGIHRGGRSIVLRPVTSREAMTAEAFHLPPPFLEEVTRSLLHVVGIDMVFYDLTSKPPATIEWE